MTDIIYDKDIWSIKVWPTELPNALDQIEFQTSHADVVIRKGSAATNNERSERRNTRQVVYRQHGVATELSECIEKTGGTREAMSETDA
jgi:hypothetical protein